MKVSTVFRGRRAVYLLLIMSATVTGAILFCLSCIRELDYSLIEKRSRVLYAADGSIAGFSLSEDNESYRFYTSVEDVSPLYIRMLLANEDRNFHSHCGVDFPAMARALWGNVSSGRITSGGSTLAMQVVKRLTGHERTYLNKLKEVVQAIYITQKFGRRQVLEWYLTLAPYGGNTEGVKAASLRWFGHLPSGMTPSEAALLTALPRAPEHIRPDRNPKAAAYYINEVLRNSHDKGVFGDDVWKSTLEDNVAGNLRSIDQSAITLASRVFSETSDREVHSYLEPSVQHVLQDVSESFREKHQDGAVLSAVVLDADTHRVTGVLGSSDLGITRICLPFSPRSPGSALKPFAYGLAFQEGRLHPRTVLHDNSKLFGSWRPDNFDRSFSGKVTAAKALVSSLNLPALEVLELIGPGYFVNSMNRNEKLLKVRNSTADYSVILGSADISLMNLARLYAMLNEDGMMNPYALYENQKLFPAVRFMEKDSARAVFNILRLTRRPDNAVTADEVSYKTGTSSRFTDALAIGSLENHTVAVAIRFPDNRTGYYQYSGFKDAAPVLFEILGRLPAKKMHRPVIESELLEISSPEALFEVVEERKLIDDKALHIDFPNDGDVVLADADGRVFIHYTGGTGTVYLSHDGEQTEDSFIQVEKEGIHTVSLLDGEGHSDSVTFRVLLGN